MPVGVRVGFSRVDITPPPGVWLAGRPALLPRRARSVRDPLFARALHIEGRSSRLAVVAADLLLVTPEMHASVAHDAGLAPAELLLCATHTHSAPGGYWRGSLIERFMGPWDPAAFGRLVQRLAAAAREARSDAAPTTLSASIVQLHGAGSSRRADGMPVDPSLALLRFDPEGRDPVCVLSFGAHPIAGLELEPRTITADYPGEVCRRLERRGLRALFLPGAAAGASPAWLRPGLDRHLARMGTALEEAVTEANERLEPVACSDVLARSARLEVGPTPRGILPPAAAGTLRRSVAIALRPVARRIAEQGRGEGALPDLRFAAIGNIGLFAAPCEIGPGVSAGLRAVLAGAGFRVPLVVSVCNGYLGYAHRRVDYGRRVALGPLGLYENAMSLAGREIGERILDAAAGLVAP